MRAGSLVELMGYGASGRTYIISDPNEGWLFAVVNGKHWLAARVPDDEVAMIANTFTIHNVDLSDTLNFRGSADIITYAIERGWYNPDEDGEFDFAAAYANPGVASNPSNYCRQWAALNHVTMTDIQVSENLPFSVKPKEKLDVQDIMEILRDHYEGTELETEAFELGNPHDWNVSTICGRATQTSFVVQLRSEMPADIGIVYWVSLAPPCGSVYIPFYFGITDFPGGYNTQESMPSAAYFDEKVQAPFEANKSEAFWTFSNFFYKADGDYGVKMLRIREEFGQIEKRIMAQQDSLEKVALDRYPQDKESVQIMLTEYSNRLYQEALEVMDEVNNSINR
jgi:dipeptidase